MPLLGTFIDLPSNVATSTLSIAGGLMSDLSSVWTMILAVLLFGIIIYFLISSFHKH